MDLTLEVVSPNGQPLGAARRKVFGPEGGCIGRAPDCDWVLPNPYISRHHATVRWISGTYYIESAGDNGVAINDPQSLLPARERRALQSGDRVFIDEYEIAVGLGQVVGDRAGAGFAPKDDPFGASPAPVRGMGQPVVEPVEPAEDLDPLKLLGGTRPVTPVVRDDWNSTPGIGDHFTPPPVPAAASNAAIPADWDRTSSERASAAQASSLRSAPPTQQSAPLPHAPASPPARPTPIPAIPDDWDKTSLGRARAASQSAPPARVPSGAESDAEPARRPAPGGGLRPGLRPQPAVPAAVQPVGETSPANTVRMSGSAAPVAVTAQPPSAVQTYSAPQQPGVVQPPGTAGDTFDVAAFFRAAGVDPANVPPETAAALGAILKSVVQGVIEVLKARAEVKEQFRLAYTRLGRAGNNPLKFSVDAQDAINLLLGRRNPAYLAPVAAFQDAFGDIRAHQMAMLAGMRAGFEHALAHFDPKQLQELFDKRVKKGGAFGLGGKPRYWECYEAELKELTQDREEAFRRLFGKSFGDAYEKQLEELKRSAGQ